MPSSSTEPSCAPCEMKLSPDQCPRSSASMATGRARNWAKRRDGAKQPGLPPNRSACSTRHRQRRATDSASGILMTTRRSSHNLPRRRAVGRVGHESRRCGGRHRKACPLIYCAIIVVPIGGSTRILMFGLCERNRCLRRRHARRGKVLRWQVHRRNVLGYVFYLLLLILLLF